MPDTLPLQYDHRRIILAGALFCMFKPLPSPTAMIRTGLVSTLVLTLGMAVPWAIAWPLLRFAAGVAKSP